MNIESEESKKLALELELKKIFVKIKYGFILFFSVQISIMVLTVIFVHDKTLTGIILFGSLISGLIAISVLLNKKDRILAKIMDIK